MIAEIWLTAGSIVVLLACAALLYAGEMALSAVSASRMHRLERQGDRRAAIVRRLRADKEAIGEAVLLGSSLVTIAAAVLATKLLVELFGLAGLVYAICGLTLCVTLFVQLLPKALALSHADAVALRLAPLLSRTVALLTPILAGLRLAERGALAVLGQAASVNPSHVEELRGAIELHRGEEREVRDERRMLRSVLELADVWVSEVMTHRRAMVAIDGALPPREIVEQVLNSPYTRIPVWLDQADNIVGVLHAKVLLRAVQSQGDLDRLDVRSTAAPAWFIPGSTTLLDQLQAFRRRREHFALVVDEYGALMGLVTLEDILEEIVGDISDEHDVAVPGVRPQPDGSFVVSGMVTIRDLNREFEWNLPDQEATTIAGLLLREARQIPEAGQSFDFYGFRFAVLRRVRNQVTSIRVRPPPRPAGAG